MPFLQMDDQELLDLLPEIDKELEADDTTYDDQTEYDDDSLWNEYVGEFE